MNVMNVMNRAKHIDTKEHGIFELCDLCEYYDQETNMHEDLNGVPYMVNKKTGRAVRGVYYGKGAIFDE